jgi:biotin transporter BioY
MWRILGYTLFVLWCLSWLPTIVGLLSERPGEKPTSRENAVRLICAANAMAFYIGGIIWLATRCSGRSGTRICLAWVVFVYSSSLGPVALAISRAVLGPRLQDCHVQRTEHDATDVT